MKKLLLLAFNLVCLSLEAIHFQNSISVTSYMDKKNEFLVEMKIEKRCEGCLIPELITSPKIICTRGEPAKITFGTEDQDDFLAIEVIILGDELENELQSKVFMKEKGQVVLSVDHNFKINNEIK